MKKFVLAFLLLSPCFAFAQKFEIGLGGGVSVNTQPTGNMYYVGTSSVANYAGSFWMLYNSWSGWQLGMNIHELELASQSSTVYKDPNYPTISYGGDDKKFVYSGYTTDICGIANKKLNTGAVEVYMGVAVGWALAKNDQYNRGTNESYKAPDNGNGLVLGGQIGLNVNFTPLVGLNFEVAPRYYDLHYSVPALGQNVSGNLNYQITAIPMTIGLRFRMASADRTNPMFDYDKYRKHHRIYGRRLFHTHSEPDGATDTRSKLMAR